MHGAMDRLNRLYERHGVDLGPLAPATTGTKKDFEGAIIVAPPSALADRWSRRFPDPVDCFDDEHPDPPPPDACDIGGVHYSTQLLEVTPDGELRRRREIAGEAHDVLTKLNAANKHKAVLNAMAMGLI